MPGFSFLLMANFLFLNSILAFRLDQADMFLRTVIIGSGEGNFGEFGPDSGSSCGLLLISCNSFLFQFRSIVASPRVKTRGLPLPLVFLSRNVGCESLGLRTTPGSARILENAL